jgi:hypothetical protein
MHSIRTPRSTPFRYAAARAAVATLTFLILTAVPPAGASAAFDATETAAPTSTETVAPRPTANSESRPARGAKSPPRDGERLVVASCRQTAFYSWPAKDGAPAPTDYPPATNGDAFHIVGALQQSLDGFALYETTIDVVAPWGSGKHYWVAARCVNAG